MGSTILDVAKICGFSKATVSRAFASPEQVNEETRNKIYEAARAVNYTPNAIARAMVRKRTDNIAFIIYEQQYPVVLNPFYSPIFEAVLQTTSKKGFSLFISSDKDVRLPNGEIYMKKQMDGVIIAGQTDAEAIVGLKKQNIPVVLLNNKLEMDDLVCITADQYGGAISAMEHLIERGHRKIGLISGKFSPYIYSSRYNAYMDTLKKYNCEIDYRFIQTIEPTMDDACRCATSLLSLEDRPTALFCTNDTIAIGAIKAVLRAGLRIPQDVAIVGYDDSDICSVIEPELTTVKVDKTQMGRLAALKLIALINGEELKERMVETPTALIVRKTT